MAGGLCDPADEVDPTIERWFDEKLGMHIDVRIGSRLLDVDPLDFRVWLQHDSARPRGKAGDRAINGRLAYEEFRASWPEPDGANQFVLVVPVDVGQDRKTVKVDLSFCVRASFLGVPEGLEAPDDSAVSRLKQLGRNEVAVEVFGGLAKGEIDKLSRPERSLRARGDKCPCQMVEGRAEVIRCVSKQKTKTCRDWFDGLKAQHYGVKLRVIFGPRRVGLVGLEPLHLSPQLAIEFLSVNYGSSPLQPGAIEGVSHAG